MGETKQISIHRVLAAAKTKRRKWSFLLEKINFKNSKFFPIKTFLKKIFVEKFLKSFAATETRRI